jgi:SAM-dependent methyltransferase
MLSWAADLTPSGVDGFLAEAMFLPAPRSRGRLLEIGCGNGAALAHMRDLGWSVLGTDFDPQAVAAARQLGLEVRLGGAECISKEDGPFDAIYLGHVIEHILDPAGLFRECQSLLSVGGRIVLLTPNAAGLGLKWFGRNWRGLESPRHLHLFNPTSIDLLCHQTGFHEFTVQTTARGSRYILGMSSILAGNTCANIGGIPVSLKMKIFTLFMQIFERIMIKFKPHIGEEMIVHIYNQALKNIQ